MKPDATILGVQVTGWMLALHGDDTYRVLRVSDGPRAWQLTIGPDGAEITEVKSWTKCRASSVS